MKLKENINIDVLKTYGFHLVEQSMTGFKRYTKHYGYLLMTICNNNLENAIQLTLDCNPKDSFENKHIIASIHQINKDIAAFAKAGLLAEEEITTSSFMLHQDWNEMIKESNPYNFLAK